MIDTKNIEGIDCLKISSLKAYFQTEFSIKRYDTKIERDSNLKDAVIRLPNRSKWLPVASISAFLDLVGDKETSAVYEAVKAELSEYLPLQENPVIEVKESDDIGGKESDDIGVVEEKEVVQVLHKEAIPVIESLESPKDVVQSSIEEKKAVQSFVDKNPNGTKLENPTADIITKIQEPVQTPIEVIEEKEVIEDFVQLPINPVQTPVESVQSVIEEKEIVQSGKDVVQSEKEIVQSDSINEKKQTPNKSNSRLVRIFTSLQFVFCAMTCMVLYVAIEITAPSMRSVGVSYWGSIWGSLAIDASAMVSILYGRKAISFVFVAVTFFLFAVKFGVTDFLSMYDFTKEVETNLGGQIVVTTVTIFSWAKFIKGLALTISGSLGFYIYSELFIEKMDLILNPKSNVE